MNNQISLNDNLSRFDDIITETHSLYNSLCKCFEEYKYELDDKENIIDEVFNIEFYIIISIFILILEKFNQVEKQT